MRLSLFSLSEASCVWNLHLPLELSHSFLVPILLGGTKQREICSIELLLQSASCVRSIGERSPRGL